MTKTVEIRVDVIEDIIENLIALKFLFSSKGATPRVELLEALVEELESKLPEEN